MSAGSPPTESGLNSWDWEDALNVEEKIYNSGLMEGQDYLSSDRYSTSPTSMYCMYYCSFLCYGEILRSDDDAIVEGYDFGFIKGLAIGMELGFMEKSLQLAIQSSSGIHINFY